MNYIIGIIWYKNYQNGQNKLSQIKEQYKKINISVQQDHKNEIWFMNGDIWKLVSSETSALANRCNISYIERGIEKRVIREIILPATTLSPYQAFKYYDEKGDSFYEL